MKLKDNEVLSVQEQLMEERNEMLVYAMLLGPMLAQTHTKHGVKEAMEFADYAMVLIKATVRP